MWDGITTRNGIRGNGPNGIRGTFLAQKHSHGFLQFLPSRADTFQTRFRRPLEAFQIGPMAGDVPGGFAGLSMGKSWTRKSSLIRTIHENI